MDVQKIEKEPGVLHLSISLDKDDYYPQYQDKLKDYRKSASLKGFRQGKAPVSIIKKMFGSQVLAEVVTRELNEKLYDVLEADKVQYYGQPLVAEDQELLDFESMADRYSMDFDVFVVPDVDIEALFDGVKVDQYLYEPTEEQVSEVLNRMRQQGGSREEVETDIQLKDMLHIKAHELEDGDIKEGGWSTDFMILMESIKDTSTRDAFLGASKGDQVDFDVWKIEDATPEMIRKHILHIEDDIEVGDLFRGEITRIERIIPADLDQDFFDSMFGEGEVSSEEEASAKILSVLQEEIEGQSKRALQHSIREQLREKADISLNRDMLRRLIKTTYSEEPTEEALDKEIKGLQLNVIQRHTATKYEVEVTEQEIFDSLYKTLENLYRQHGLHLDEDQILESADNYMEDEKIYEQQKESLLTDKIAEVWQNELEIHVNTLDKDAFEAKLQEIYNN